METTKRQTATLFIGGMACSGCAGTVQQALSDIKGVNEATVDLKRGSATVTFNPEIVSTESFGQAIEEAGYKFKETEN